MTQSLVLASASPRRRELLGRLGYDFSIDAPDIDESVVSGESPVAYVRRLAGAKCRHVMARHLDDVVVAADTTVALRSTILTKPLDDDDACRMLAQLSGRWHRVHTGLAVGSRRGVDVVVRSSSVLMASLSETTIRRYVATGEPSDKAGAYAIQGLGSQYVAEVRGSVTSIIGLPLDSVSSLLLNHLT